MVRGTTSTGKHQKNCGLGRTQDVGGCGVNGERVGGGVCVDSSSLPQTNLAFVGSLKPIGADLLRLGSKQPARPAQAGKPLGAPSVLQGQNLTRILPKETLTLDPHLRTCYISSLLQPSSPFIKEVWLSFLWRRLL